MESLERCAPPRPATISVADLSFMEAHAASHASNEAFSAATTRGMDLSIVKSMPSDVRSALLAISLTFLAVGMYHRIRAARAGDKLDRTKEGWPILIGIRVGGLITF